MIKVKIKLRGENNSIFYVKNSKKIEFWKMMRNKNPKIIKVFE